jgi:hypothetical protein
LLAVIGDRERQCSHPFAGSAFVSFYRAYVIDQDGHFLEVVNLECASDAAAVEAAQQLVNGHDVELWQEDRMITKLATSEPK